jgi:hypothetical protein
MTGAVLPILSYGATAGNCDLEFIAGTSEASGVSTRPDDEFGEVLNTSAFFDSLGTTTYALVSLGEGFMQLIFDSDVEQDAFVSLTIEQWGETFLAAEADYNNTPGVDTFFTWFTSENEFIEDEEYCMTMEQPAACDIDFTAGTVGLNQHGFSDITGSTSGGTLISTSEFMDSLGSEFRIYTDPPFFFEIRINNTDLLSDAFEEVHVMPWDETFTTATALFAVTVDYASWSWTSSNSVFVDDTDYCLTLTP